VKKTSEERGMAEHNFTVLCKNRAGKALCKGVGNHEVGPKRNKLHNTSRIKLTAKMYADVNVARRFSAKTCTLMTRVRQRQKTRRVSIFRFACFGKGRWVLENLFRVSLLPSASEV
jgi:hypothetical protein